MAHCWLIRRDAQHIHHVVTVPKIIREVLLYRRRDKDTAARADAMATLTALARTEEGQARKV
jgi:hypothetical protein